MKHLIGLVAFLLNFVFHMRINCLNYSSKTAYRDLFTKEQYEFIENPDNYKIKNCEPIQINIFLRHGARYPSNSQVEKSRQFLDNLRQELKSASKKKHLFDELRVTFEDKPHFGLSDLGVKEMQEIAQRFKKRYPNLFNIIKNNSLHVDLQSSNKSRSIDSGHNFLHGLNVFDLLSSKIVLNDTMIRFFDSCARYVEQAAKKKKESELFKFQNGKEMLEVIERFKERNKLPNMQIEPKTLIKLFSLCNIERAHKMKENWCKLFDKSDYEIFGYYFDLKAYWIKSYGDQLNSKVMMLYIQDLVFEMEKMMQNHDQKRQVLLRFGHAENIFPLVTAFGLFKDNQTLRHDNFLQNLDRKFKTARFAAFSSNMAFVLHKCGPSSQYKVKILLNEMPIELYHLNESFECAFENENQSDKSLCMFEKFKKQLSSYLDESYKEVCDLDRQSVSTNDDNLELKNEL